MGAAVAVAAVAAVVFFNRDAPAPALPATDVAEFRTQMRDSGQHSCLVTAKAKLADAGRTVSDDAVSRYCDCAMTQANANLSDADIPRAVDAVQRTHAPPGWLLEIFAKAAQSCQASLGGSPQ